VVLILIAFFLAGRVKSLLRTGLERSRVEVTLARFFANLASYGVLLLSGLAILEFFGVPTTSFAAVLAAAGLAIGLALQGTLSNFAAGVMLLTFRPFRVGDVVVLGGVTGTVWEI